MKLSHIPLEPRSHYEGKAIFRTTYKGAMITEGIRFDTDAHANPINFQTSGKSSPFGQEDYSVIYIENKASGKKLDLRFHEAALQNQLWLAEEAMKAGSDINVTIKQRSTALHWAAAHGNQKVVRWLLDHGANAQLVDELGWTAPQLASKQGHEEVLKEFGAGAGQADQFLLQSAMLVDACAKGTMSVVQSLLAGGADVNASHNGFTALYVACQTGHAEIAELLIGKGANVNAAILDGGTALHVAAEEGNKRIVEMLLAKGAAVNAKNQKGATPLRGAVVFGRKDVMICLLNRGADTHLLADDNVTLVQIAKASGHGELVTLLTQLEKSRGIKSGGLAEALRQKQGNDGLQHQDNGTVRGEPTSPEAGSNADTQTKLHRKKIETERMRQRVCTMCGGSLGFFAKLFGQVMHARCSEFVDTPPRNEQTGS